MDRSKRKRRKNRANKRLKGTMSRKQLKIAKREGIVW